jgi:thymidine phosphorylase
MSKKIASGTEALVLDVKTGSGAFKVEVDQARRLAETMVSLGEAAGVRTVALLTDMSVPLGVAVGNAVEVAESVDVLRGAGPPDVVELTVALAEVMLELAGIDADPGEVLASGAALPVWEQLVAAQGGDPSAALPVARFTHEVRADASGFVTGLDAKAVGVAAWRLGAGRARKEDPVSPGAGILCWKKPGDAVEAGEVVLELRYDDEAKLAGGLAALDGEVVVGPEAPPPRKLILERIG